ncbi:MAG: Tetratricopeptide 2 repeat protein [Geminicoccaceae bacterium]|nr:Tetratricopeptide 2 repeat protein [Geminicoccaceae bacterium]
MPGRGRALPAPAFVDLMDRARVRRLGLLGAALAAAFAYANALHNGFVLDDGAIVLRNPLVTSPATSWRAFFLPYWPESLGGGQYRPLGIVSFALDWLVSGGDARWFHTVNVLWHVAATAAVWLLAAELLAPVAATVAALLFAVHPVHVEAVANTVGRLEPMAALFVMIALLAHRHRSRAAAVWFALGLLSKESAIVFLGLAAANDLFLERDWRAALRTRRVWYAGYAAVVIAYVIVLVAVFHDRSMANPARALAGATTGERLAMAAQVIPHYVRLLLAPAELSGSYAPMVIAPQPWGSLAVLVGLATALIALIAIVVIASRRRWPVLAFALVWIPISLAPVSNVFFTSGVVLAERTLYLASAGVCLAAGAVAERFLIERAGWVTVATCSITLAFGARTWTRTPVWRDDKTYVATLLDERPESYEGYLVYGRVLKMANLFDEAERELTKARHLFKRDPMVYYEAADLAVRQGRLDVAAALLDSAKHASSFPVVAR